MKSLTIVALLGLALASATPVLAETPQASPAPPPTGTPKQQAETLIAATGHPELFDNRSDDREIMIVHRASGLICRFTLGDATNKLMIFGGLPVGDDVGCNTNIGPLNLTVYATRYPAAITLDNTLAQASGEIRGRWANARPYSGGVVQAKVPAGFDTAFAAFLIGASPRIGYTHVRLAKADGWTFMQRLTADEDVFMAQDMLLGSPRWTEVLTAAAAHQTAD